MDTVVVAGVRSNENVVLTAERQSRFADGRPTEGRVLPAGGTATLESAVAVGKSEYLLREVCVILATIRFVMSGRSTLTEVESS